MFATGNEERCPVMLFKRYLEKRPIEMQKGGPFYLTVIEKPLSSIWYKKTTLGKNAINTIMKNMKENSPAEGSVSREEFYQPQCKENGGQETDKFRYTEV